MFSQIQAIFETLQAYPPLAMVLVALPFLFLAYARRIYPTRIFVAVLAVPFVLSLALLAKRDALPLIAVADVIAVIVALGDLFTLPRRSVFSVTRDIGRIASLHKRQPVALTVANRSDRSFVVAVRDGLPESCTTDSEFERVRLAAKSRATLHFHIDCQRRGAHRLSEVYLRAVSRYGLWQRMLSYPVESELHVYPDMQQLSKYAMLARTNRLSLIGVRRRRKIGQDNEFERLRDFTRDDQYKHIDWRSTARRNKLTVRDFQTNQSQRMIFLVDCGRMMVNESQGLTLLDHALNAMLMLSYVALRQGDAVGMLAFSDTIHSFVPVRGGMQQMNRLLHASFDRFPQLVESRYDEAFLHLSNKCRKRSLVVLMTNVIDEVNAWQIESYLGSIAGHHLPLCVLLRDPRLFAAADRPLGSSRSAEQLADEAGTLTAEDFESDFATAEAGGLYVAAAASGILTWRHQVLNQLHHRGVLVLDAFPEEITAPLVNQYLEIKARHLL
jgi:uncharacterized protein (DUF58 family)